MIFLGLLFYAIHAHYRAVARRLQVEDEVVMLTGTQRQQPVIVPIDTVSKATLRAVDYARSISENVVGLHVTDDLVEAQNLRSTWESAILDTPLVIIDSPYRSFIAPVVSYVEAVQEQSPGGRVTVVLPVYQATYPWQQVLHNQIGRQLRSALRDHEGVVTTEVIYHLDEADEDVHRVVHA
jgi:hypothetical protein